MSVSSERGQAMPLVLVLLALAIAAVLLLVELGVAAAERTRAQTAADAAALAAAVDGPRAAEAAATANGAALVDYRELEGTVEVAIRYRRARAVAAAHAPPAPVSPVDLAPIMVAAMTRAEHLLGHPIPVVAGAGVLVELPPEGVAELLTVARDVGLCQQSPETDPVHFGPCPPTPPR